jgi:hypothetical protein
MRKKIALPEKKDIFLFYSLLSLNEKSNKNFVMLI